jgi:hypothetical protein
MSKLCTRYKSIFQHYHINISKHNHDSASHIHDLNKCHQAFMLTCLGKSITNKPNKERKLDNRYSTIRGTSELSRAIRGRGRPSRS